jgi:hypothetical protein
VHHTSGLHRHREHSTTNTWWTTPTGVNWRRNAQAGEIVAPLIK